MASFTKIIVCMVYSIWITSSYYVVNISKTWDDADLFCQSQCDSHLASIHSVDNFTEVVRHSYEWSLDGAWVGLRYNSSDIFRWTDHTSFDFGNQLNGQLPWAVDEPSGDGQCVRITTKERKGTWNDSLCSRTYAFVCNQCFTFSSISPTISPSSTSNTQQQQDTTLLLTTNVTKKGVSIQSVGETKSEDRNHAKEQFESIQFALYGGGILFVFFICCVCLWIASAVIKRTQWRYTPNAIRVPDFEDIEIDPDNPVGLWLMHAVQLPEYYGVFMRQGYHSMDSIKDIQDRSQLQKMGIALRGHQTRIMAQIEALQTEEVIQLSIIHTNVKKNDAKPKPQMIHCANQLDADVNDIHDSTSLIQKRD